MVAATEEAEVGRFVLGQQDIKTVVVNSTPKPIFEKKVTMKVVENFCNVL